jgi:acyl carrier protein
MNIVPGRDNQHHPTTTTRAAPWPGAERHEPMSDDWTEQARLSIERYLLDSHCQNKRIDRIHPGESLFELGVLDSLALVQTISFLEGAFQVTIDDTDVVPDNFESISAVVALIARCRQSEFSDRD